MIKNFKSKWRHLKFRNGFCHLNRQVIEVNNLLELMKLFGWKEQPLLDRPDIHDFDYLEDLNERRIRDAEVLATAMKNLQPKIALEIGTAMGMGTRLMALNSPESKIFTVNIPPEEIKSGAGGELTTIALERDRIGSNYRELGLKNITQIFANTRNWTPEMGTIDLAFIDGCHDFEFVYQDTLKALRKMKAGSFLIWHDFNPDLSKKFDWIFEVCSAVESLYRDGELHDRIYHLADSWCGIYRVPK